MLIFLRNKNCFIWFDWVSLLFKSLICNGHTCSVRQNFFFRFHLQLLCVFICSFLFHFIWKECYKISLRRGKSCWQIKRHNFRSVGNRLNFGRNFMNFASFIHWKCKCIHSGLSNWFSNSPFPSRRWRCWWVWVCGVHLDRKW